MMQGKHMAGLNWRMFTSPENSQREFRGVKVCSVHPGAVRTELNRYIIDGYPCLVYSMLCICSPLYFLMMKNVWWGTQTNLHCSLMPIEQIENGRYYADCKTK